MDEYAAGMASAAQRAGDDFMAAGPKPKAKERPMTPKGQEIVARYKEIFYAYSNRKADDNRTAQTHLGPSEIGTPCDRRLAMSLMRLPAVNPGGDGWAAFRGTCVHAGLAEMFLWADAGSGRFAVEQRLELPSELVPGGTVDLHDRVLAVTVDEKVMGEWSLNRLKTDGPTPTYRVQVHTYAYGLRIRGEVISDVAIVAWPSDKSSLDDMYAWTEPYNAQIARDALARVDSVSEAIADYRNMGVEPLTIASEITIDNSDCKFCPFYLRDAADLTNGACNGRK